MLRTCYRVLSGHELFCLLNYLSNLREIQPLPLLFLEELSVEGYMIQDSRLPIPVVGYFNLIKLSLKQVTTIMDHGHLMVLLEYCPSFEYISTGWVKLDSRMQLRQLHIKHHLSLPGCTGKTADATCARIRVPNLKHSLSLCPWRMTQIQVTEMQRVSSTISKSAQNGFHALFFRSVCYVCMRTPWVLTWEFGGQIHNCCWSMKLRSLLYPCSLIKDL